MNNRKNPIKFYIFIIKTIKKDNNMSQKIALVTGGSSGIGRELAIELANKDYKVFITGKNKYELSVTEHNAKNCATIIPIVVNFNELKFEKKILSFLKDNLKPNEKIDKLIHCAATTGPLSELIKTSSDERKKCMRVNAKAPIDLTNLLLNEFFCDSKTRILFLDCDFSETNRKQASRAYHISKLALNFEVNYLRFKLKNKVFIGLFNPGPTKNTKIFHQLQGEKLKQTENQMNIASLPTQLTELAESQDVAECIVKVLEDTSDQDFTKINWDYRKKEEQLKNIKTSAAESKQVESRIEATKPKINRIFQQIPTPSFFANNSIASSPTINASITSIWKLNTFT